MSHAYSLLAKICEWELLQFTTEDSKKTLNEMLSYGKKAEELDSKNPIAAYNIARHYFFRENSNKQNFIQNVPFNSTLVTLMLKTY